MTSLYRTPTRPAPREDAPPPGREPEPREREAAGLSRAELRQIVADLLG